MLLLLVNETGSPDASGKTVVSNVAFKEASEIVALCPTTLWTNMLTRKLRNRVVPLHAACILLGRSFRV
jgi:hypothetical protein